MPTLPESENWHLSSIVYRPLIHGNTEISAALINIDHCIKSFPKIKGTKAMSPINHEDGEDVH